MHHPHTPNKSIPLYVLKIYDYYVVSSHAKGRGLGTRLTCMTLKTEWEQDDLHPPEGYETIKMIKSCCWTHATLKITIIPKMLI